MVNQTESQMTLGELISQLESMPPDSVVANLRDPDSYRGCYDDLYFERAEGTRPASELLAVSKAALKQVFEGYKGGKYVMGTLTPLWIASYGCCGDKLMSLKSGGDIETEKDEEWLNS